MLNPDKMKQALERTMHFIGAIPVTGNGQDLAVAAKSEIRAAIELLQEDKDPSGQNITYTD